MKAVVFIEMGVKGCLRGTEVLTFWLLSKTKYSANGCFDHVDSYHTFAVQVQKFTKPLNMGYKYDLV